MNCEPVIFQWNLATTFGRVNHELKSPSRSRTSRCPAWKALFSPTPFFQLFIMDCREKSTEWALLFPLKIGLFAMKSSVATRNMRERDVYREKYPRTRIRRGSSLSDLDKFQPKTILPDVVRSAEKGSESLPHSPALSRNNLQLGHAQVRGSIGDLMNLKIYGGSNWSVRSETLIAKVVPLSTVTSKQTSPVEEVEMEDREDDVEDFPVDSKTPLTCAQRTQRLSMLIRRQHKSKRYQQNVFQRKLVSFWKF